MIEVYWGNKIYGFYFFLLIPVFVDLFIRSTPELTGRMCRLALINGCMTSPVGFVIIKKSLWPTLHRCCLPLHSAIL
jgi:hypothetical protein